MCEGRCSVRVWNVYGVLSERIRSGLRTRSQQARENAFFRSLEMSGKRWLWLLCRLAGARNACGKGWRLHGGWRRAVGGAQKKLHGMPHLVCGASCSFSLFGAVAFRLSGGGAWHHGFSHLSNHSKKVRCHRIPFCGFSTQWFSSGKMSSSAGMPRNLAASKAAMAWLARIR